MGIFKDSGIYKGPGLYKVGGSNTKENVFSVPFCKDIRTTFELESSIYIQDNILKKTKNDRQGLTLGKLPFNTALEYELKFTFKYNANTSIYSQIIGGQYYFWRDPTIWRAQLENGLSYIAFGVPDGTDQWINAIRVATEILETDIVKVIAKCNNTTKKIELSLYKNGSFVNKNEMICNIIDYSRAQNIIMLDAGNEGNTNHCFLGEIYLDDSYIKIDGQRYF